MKNNKIKDVCLEHLQNSICHQTMLETLDLSYNDLTSTSLASIVKILPSTPSLKTINLSHNYITDRNIKRFVIKIHNEVRLNNLNLSYNLITDKGTSPFVEHIFVDQDSTMTNIDLSGNPISSRAKKNLMKSLRLSKIQRDARPITLLINNLPLNDEILKEYFKECEVADIEILRKPLGKELKELPVRIEMHETIKYFEERLLEICEGVDPTLEEIQDILIKIESLP